MRIANAVIPAAGGDAVMNLGTLVQIKVPSTATDGAFSVAEHTVPPLAGPPLHTHPETEILYVLAGEFDVGIGVDTVRAKEGAVIHVLGGVDVAAVLAIAERHGMRMVRSARDAE